MLKPGCIIIGTDFMILLLGGISLLGCTCFTKGIDFEQVSAGSEEPILE